MRSLSFLNNKFLPADWVGYPKINSKYYDEIKRKQPNFILYRGKNNISDNCYVKKNYGSKQFSGASRNPFNSGSLYTVKLFHIDPNKCDYKKLGLFN